VPFTLRFDDRREPARLSGGRLPGAGPFRSTHEFDSVRRLVQRLSRRDFLRVGPFHRTESGTGQLQLDLPQRGDQRPLWYSNIPAFIEQDCTARLQCVPKIKQIGYYSDAYKLEFILPKFNMYRRILARILASSFARDRG